MSANTPLPAAAADQSRLSTPSLQARPLEDGLAEAIDEGKIGPRDDPKVRLWHAVALPEGAFSHRPRPPS